MSSGLESDVLQAGQVLRPFGRGSVAIEQRRMEGSMMTIKREGKEIDPRVTQELRSPKVV